MAFIQNEFGNIGGINRKLRGGQIFNYVNPDDTLAEITAPGYFNKAASAFGIHDEIHLVGTEGPQVVRVVNASIPIVVGHVSGGGVQDITDSGVASLVTGVTLITTTGAAQVITLADGFFGQHKIFFVVSNSGATNSLITPANFADGTSLEFDGDFDTVGLVWLGSIGWKTMDLRAMIFIA